jgi:hypothetical protein
MFDLRPRLVHSLKNRQVFFNANVDLPCAVCGQNVAFAPRVSGVLCGHCGSPLHRQPDDATPVGPTRMLPFRLSEQDAQARLAAAATEPAAVAGAQPPRLRKVYVPYWHLAAHIATSWRVGNPARMDPVDSALGHVAVDYDELLLAVPPEGEGAILPDLTAQVAADASDYEPSRLGGIEVRTPTFVLVDAWTASREAWEPRLRKQIKGEYGLLKSNESIELIVTEYSQERAGMLLVPIYLPEPTSDGVSVPLAVDGYSGDVLRPRPRSAKPDGDDDDDADAAELPQVPEAFIGGAVLVVIAGVLVLFGLWFAQRLWFY